ncbi:hypothetical protein FISHEDRAFT_59034 [Fistulina hepatica ATCC 64428]|uniref:Uncharacterized protein n=1 Tax=Fistulina hepatica ATCC 64428 TaxID=1128425 RepID=A0A0D7ABJ1_9AGAR|nr:hypothetical protein FISHEDRAFT_59034 [Fistulina hepatica ATCC 64428]
MAVASVPVGAGAIHGSTLETPKSQISLAEKRALYDTPEGLPAHRLQGKNKQAVLDGMWIKGRCALLHGKGGLELAHLVAFSTSNNEREQLERAMGIMDGGLNINTRGNLIEVCMIVHDLLDGQHGVLVPRDMVASQVMKIAPPSPPVNRYEDLPYLNGERDAVREYLYVCVDRKNDIHESNLIMGRTVISPNPRVVFGKALQDAGNASLGFVRASDLPSVFSLVQPARLEQVSAWTTMPRAYLNANPSFIMLNAGRTLDKIQRLDPGRDLGAELLERFAGTDGEQYVEEVCRVFKLCQNLYKKCFPVSDKQAKKRAGADSDARDVPYIPRHNSPPSSDTQDTPPSSSPLAPVRSQNPYKEKLRKNRPEEGTFRESSIDAEPLDFTILSDEEPSSPPAQEAVPVPPEVVSSVDLAHRSVIRFQSVRDQFLEQSRRPECPSAFQEDQAAQCKTLFFSLIDFVLNEDTELLFDRTGTILAGTKSFLISPPGSLPVGWEQIQDDPPNATPLAAATTSTSTWKRDLIPPNGEDGVRVGVFVENCDFGDEEEMREED